MSKWDYSKPLEYVKCGLCGADDTRLVTIEDSFKIVRCKRCGLIYLNPRPKEEDLLEFYGDFFSTDEKSVSQWSRLMGKVYKETKRNIEREYSSGKLLDMGCGLGLFLKLWDPKKWELFGMDISKKAVEYAKSKGLNVREGSLEKAGFSNDYFDVITMFYVLEHLPNPLKVLKEVRRVLKKDGLLVVRTPQSISAERFLKFFGVRRNLFHPPMHLYDFSTEILREFLLKAGFKRIKTIIGKPTSPERRMDRLWTNYFNLWAQGIYFLTAKKVLVPGVSKTTYAKI
ncbi:methyltransferase domain-containing protein [bacterium]|nr:methyltransferase domain-containing protein [bacterium]MCG2676223.1 methyltransferase domain-containing protein [bacterium]MCG2677740.1 methyltransferase domain-containing protein [bacterium]